MRKISGKPPREKISREIYFCGALIFVLQKNEVKITKLSFFIWEPPLKKNSLGKIMKQLRLDHILSPAYPLPAPVRGGAGGGVCNIINAGKSLKPCIRISRPRRYYRRSLRNIAYLHTPPPAPPLTGAGRAKGNACFSFHFLTKSKSGGAKGTKKQTAVHTS